MSGTSPFASVIIPSFNDGVLLARCLRSLNALSSSRDSFEVVVTLDGSWDGSSELLARAVGKDISGPLDAHMERGELKTLPLRVLELEKNQGRSVARNAAMKTASGETFLFLDADLRVGSNWLNHLLSAQKNSSCVPVGEMVYEMGLRDSVHGLPNPDLLLPTPAAESQRVKGLARYQRYLETRGPWKFRDEAEMPPRYFYTCNSCVHRELVNQAGLFDETLRGWGGEDIDMGLRLAQAGGRLLPCPKARALHAQERPFKGHLANLASFGETILPYLIDKHPELYEALALHRYGASGVLATSFRIAHTLGLHRFLAQVEAATNGFAWTDRLYDLTVFLHYAGAWWKTQQREGMDS
jgi:GT2 family glycosyltransferase